MDPLVFDLAAQLDARMTANEARFASIKADASELREKIYQSQRREPNPWKEVAAAFNATQFANQVDKMIEEDSWYYDPDSHQLHVGVTDDRRCYIFQGTKRGGFPTIRDFPRLIQIAEITKLYFEWAFKELAQKVFPDPIDQKKVADYLLAKSIGKKFFYLDFWQKISEGTLLSQQEKILKVESKAKAEAEVEKVRELAFYRIRQIDARMTVNEARFASIKADASELREKIYQSQRRDPNPWKGKAADFDRTFQTFLKQFDGIKKEDSWYYDPVSHQLHVGVTQDSRCFAFQDTKNLDDRKISDFPLLDIVHKIRNIHREWLIQVLVQPVFPNTIDREKVTDYLLAKGIDKEISYIKFLKKISEGTLSSQDEKMLKTEAKAKVRAQAEKLSELSSYHVRQIDAEMATNEARFSSIKAEASVLREKIYQSQRRDPNPWKGRAADFDRTFEAFTKQFYEIQKEDSWYYDPVSHQLHVGVPQDSRCFAFQDTKNLDPFKKNFDNVHKIRGIHREWLIQVLVQTVFPDQIDQKKVTDYLLAKGRLKEISYIKFLQKISEGTLSSQDEKMLKAEAKAKVRTEAEKLKEQIRSQVEAAIREISKGVNLKKVEQELKDNVVPSWKTYPSSIFRYCLELLFIIKHPDQSHGDCVYLIESLIRDLKTIAGSSSDSLIEWKKFAPHLVDIIIKTNQTVKENEQKLTLFFDSVLTEATDSRFFTRYLVDKELFLRPIPGFLLIQLTDAVKKLVNS